MIAALTMLASVVSADADACSLLTAREIEAAMKAKVAKRVPSSTRDETVCTYEVGPERIIVSYSTNPNREPKAKSIDEDPFICGLSRGPNIKDYGNTGCKITDAGVLFITGCNHYQPRWLHLAAQTHGRTPIPIHTVKSLLDKAASKFR